MKDFIFYNQKHNSMWLCVKEHGNKSFENMWCFYRIRNGCVDINFYNPDFLSEFGLVEIGEL